MTTDREKFPPSGPYARWYTVLHLRGAKFRPDEFSHRLPQRQVVHDRDQPQAVTSPGGSTMSNRALRAGACAGLRPFPPEGLGAWVSDAAR
jgi:hypothetical protein